MTQSANAPETKSADPTAAFEEFARAFEAATTPASPRSTGASAPTW